MRCIRARPEAPFSLSGQEALSLEFRSGVPLRMVCAHDLVLVMESFMDLMGKFELCITSMEAKGQMVSVTKINIMISCIGAIPVVKSGKKEYYAFSVIGTGRATNVEPMV